LAGIDQQRTIGTAGQYRLRNCLREVGKMWGWFKQNAEILRLISLLQKGTCTHPVRHHRNGSPRAALFDGGGSGCSEPNLSSRSEAKVNPTLSASGEGNLRTWLTANAQDLANNPVNPPDPGHFAVVRSPQQGKRPRRVGYFLPSGPSSLRLGGYHLETFGRVVSGDAVEPHSPRHPVGPTIQPNKPARCDLPALRSAARDSAVAIGGA
jgi:hypothetical protein